MAAAGAPATAADAGGLARISDRSWFNRPAAEVAADLLGCTLVHDAPDGRVAGRLVEVEAYQGPEDLAAHSARGRTPRNAVMFGPPGHLYVYLIYGLHHCANIVAGPGAKPEAVLVRALEIDEGVELARCRRGPDVPTERLASGPGNVARALGLDRSHDGHDLLDGPVRITPRPGPMPRLSRGPRVGVAYAGDWAQLPLRFWIADDRHVSRR
jgi:DNA-3-methyladenine glycosylase